MYYDISRKDAETLLAEVGEVGDAERLVRALITNDADNLTAMLDRAGVKWTRDDNQRSQRQGSAFLIATEQPPGRFYSRTLYVVYDFDREGRLLGIQVSE